MKTLLDLIQSGDFAQRINSQLGIGALAQIAQSHQRLQNGLGITGMHDALLKGLSLPSSSFPRDFPALGAIAMATALQNQFQVPTSALEAINAINNQHERLFDGLGGMAASMKAHNSAFVHIHNLQFALNGLSGQVASMAAAQRDWSLLNDFEAISEEAIDITSNISSDHVFSEEEIKRFKKLIASIVVFLKRNKQFGVCLLVALDIFIRLADLHQYYDFVTEKTVTATREDIDTLKRTMIQEIAAQLKEEKEYRTTNRACKVMLKPKSKTMLLTSLPVNFEVIVLQVRHKWIYVSYINPNDNLPETGWILKKYLNKPN